MKEKSPVTTSKGIEETTTVAISTRIEGVATVLAQKGVADQLKSGTKIGRWKNLTT